MHWDQARSRTIQEWKRIRSAIGSDEELAILTDINAECDLCRTARDAAQDSAHRCEACLGFQQFGGCYSANLAMSELVMDKDWDGLRKLVDDFIVALERLDTNAETEPLVELPTRH
jgi:hypothetical protein